MCAFAFAQSPLPELDKTKETKLLESTGEDVKRILADYEHDADEKENAPNSKTKISVTTEAVDLENDFLTFNYDVSIGKIVGQGAKVIWDLSGIEPGTYTITAGVDDGCGVCGKTVTKTVIVKRCPDCSIK